MRNPPSVTLVLLAAGALGCEPIYVGVVAVPGQGLSAPGSRGVVVVREPWGPGGKQLAQVTVASGARVVTPLADVDLRCEPRETCAIHGDLVQLLSPSRGLPDFDIVVEKPGYAPAHVKIPVESARDVPWRQVFVVLAPSAEGYTP